MKSHLPEPVLRRLVRFIHELDEALQAETHKIEVAIGVDLAFDEGYVESSLRRSLISAIAHRIKIPGLEVRALGNGGIDVYISFGGVTRVFRLKHATLDQYGVLVVRVSSDSLLTKYAITNTPSFWDEEPQPLPEGQPEQWVLAYVLHPGVKVFERVVAAYPVDIAGEASPYRLVLDRHTTIPLGSPTPPGFHGSDEDLDLDKDREEDDGEEGVG